MASNFRISVHRNSDNVHLKLMGDFDGTSAWELLDVLKKNSDGVRKVIIHTSSLKNVYPFGRNTFHQNLCDLKSHQIQILFTGGNAKMIAPEKSFCL